METSVVTKLNIDSHWLNIQLLVVVVEWLKSTMSLWLCDTSQSLFFFFILFFFATLSRKTRLLLGVIRQSKKKVTRRRRWRKWRRKNIIHTQASYTVSICEYAKTFKFILRQKNERDNKPRTTTPTRMASTNRTQSELRMSEKKVTRHEYLHRVYMRVFVFCIESSREREWMRNKWKTRECRIRPGTEFIYVRYALYGTHKI